MMRKSPQIIVDVSKLTETVIIPGQPHHVRWWNKPLGEYYTVGESLVVAVVFLVILAIMLAVWSS